MTALYRSVKSVPRQIPVDTVATGAARLGQFAGAGPAASEEASCKGLVALRNGALAAERVCLLRYRLRRVRVQGKDSSRIAGDAGMQAAAALVHADRLAECIMQLRGEPEIDPFTRTQRGHAGCGAEHALSSMCEANLGAERVAIETYDQLARLVGVRDPSTLRLLLDLLADQKQHANEFRPWLSP